MQECKVTLKVLFTGGGTNVISLKVYNIEHHLTYMSTIVVCKLYNGFCKQ